MVTLNAISTIPFLVHVSSVVTIDLGAPIVGCSAVGCPQSETNSSLPDCHVPDYGNSSMIGVAELNFSISSDFAWTQAVSITPNVTYVDPSPSWEFIFWKWNSAFGKRFAAVGSALDLPQTY